MKALLLESNPADRGIAEDALRELGYDLTVRETWQGFFETWDGMRYALVIADADAYKLAGGRRDLIAKGLLGELSLYILTVSDETFRNSLELSSFEVDDFFVKPLNRAAMETQLRFRRRQLQNSWDKNPLLDQFTLFVKAFETMHVGVTITDTEGRILYVNPADASMHGYTVEELTGKNVRIFSTSRHWKVPSLEQMREFYSWRRETINKRKDQTLFPVMLNSDVVKNAAGDPIGLVTICEDITTRKVADEVRQRDQERLARLTHDNLHDSLTGLPNRSLFFDRLQAVLNRMERLPNNLFAVLYMDLDQFKKINDLYGHFMGDQVLKQLASRLHSCLRPADTVARLGGDEFAVLLDEIKDVPNALSVVARIQATIQKPFPLSEKGITGTVSIGVSLGTSHTLTPEELLRRGDIAMYRAKARGGGQYVIYDSTLDGSNGRTDNAAAK